MDTMELPDPPVRPPDSRTPPVPPECKLGWQPSIMAPVFFGYREMRPEDGPPMKAFIAFPTIGTRPHEAVPVTGCGRFPLVLLLNGQCIAEPDHFERWALMATSLARAGYVVAVPDIDHTDPPWDSETELAGVHQLLSWMRGGWEVSSILLPRHATAVIGHSYGALLAGRLAADQAHPFSAYVFAKRSVAGVHHLAAAIIPLGPPVTFHMGHGKRRLRREHRFDLGADGVGEAQDPFPRRSAFRLPAHGRCVVWPPGIQPAVRQGRDDRPRDFIPLALPSSRALEFSGADHPAQPS
jgi:hypothetical protein